MTSQKDVINSALSAIMISLVVTLVALSLMAKAMSLA